MYFSFFGYCQQDLIDKNASNHLRVIRCSCHVKQEVTSSYVCICLLFQIVRSLLDVFVGIEMTGQSVAFEQKFNYRRPMYIVMDYLWQIEEHAECFQ
jgi:hypothetical protein